MLFECGNTPVLSILMGQAELGGILQVFFNLNCLELQTHKTVGWIIDKLIQASRSALDPSLLPDVGSGHGSTTKSKTGMAGAALAAADSTAWKEALWGRVEKLLDAVHTHAVQVR